MSSSLQFLARRALPCTARSSSPSLTPSLLAPTRSFSSTRTSQLATCHLVGRLTRDTEIKANKNGGEMIKYTVASSTGPKNDRRPNFWSVVYFIDPKTNPAKKDYLLSMGKGSLVAVDGEMTQRKIELPDGTFRTDVSVMQRNIEILQKRDTAEAGAEGQEQEQEGTEEEHV